jgi:hypothetical protein
MRDLETVLSICSGEIESVSRSMGMNLANQVHPMIDCEVRNIVEQ